MRRILLTLSVIVFASPAYADEGFTPLFNGKDLNNWDFYLENNVKKDDVWSVKDGVIICKGKPNGYLITPKEYGNYVLKVQWRFPADSKGGNSGVFLHVQTPPDKIWPKGYEAQLFAHRAGDFWLVDGAKMDVDKSRQDQINKQHFLRMGDSYEKTGAKDDKGRDKYKINTTEIEKPFGEWNQYEIVCKDNMIKLHVNGKLVNEGMNAEFTKGKILLQSEGAEIHFRNVEIRALR